VSDGTFWLVAFGLYLLDNVKLIDARELVLRETLLLRWRVELMAVPFLLRGRCMVLLNPLMPFCMVFKMKWMESGATDYYTLRSDRWLTLSFQKRAMAFRFITLCSFATLFGLGPILTYKIGLGATLLLLGPVHALLITMAATLAFFNRLNVPNRRLFFLILECAFCPMYLPALLRRISWHAGLSADGVAFARRYLLPDDRLELAFAVKARSEEMIEDCGDEEERAEILHYLRWATT
jgi:hypothetical protein